MTRLEEAELDTSSIPTICDEVATALVVEGRWYGHARKYVAYPVRGGLSKIVFPSNLLCVLEALNRDAQRMAFSLITGSVCTKSTEWHRHAQSPR